MDFDIFNYLILLLIDIKLSCDDKCDLSITNIHEARILLLQKLQEHFAKNKKYLSQGDISTFQDFVKTNVGLTITDEVLLVHNVAKLHPKLFQFKNGTLYLNPTLDRIKFVKIVVDLENEIFDSKNKYVQNILRELDFTGSDDDLLKALNVTKLTSMMKKIMFLESQIEANYPNRDYVEHQEKCSYKLFKQMASSIDYDMGMYYYNYLLNFDKPYKLNLFSNEARQNKFFIQNSHLDTMDFAFYQAVFSDKNLYFDRIKIKLDLLLIALNPDDDIDEEIDDEYIEHDDEDEYYEESENEEFDENDDLDNKELEIIEMKTEIVLFLMYYKVLSDYENSHEALKNHDIKKIKARILYLINAFGYNIFDDEVLFSLLNNYLKDDIYTQRDYEYNGYALSRMFLIDIFECGNVDETTELKILFIKSYYELTHDKLFRIFIFEYKNNEYFEVVYNSIFKNTKIELGSKHIREK